MSLGFKIVGGVLAVVVIAIVGAAVSIYSNLDSIVKDAVEDYGAQYTGVSVRLKKAELSPENGEGKLFSLIVGNPAGFKTDSAFKLAIISMILETVLPQPCFPRRMQLDWRVRANLDWKNA